MAVYFLDSSAVVKYYFQEQGHSWVQALHNPAQGHRLYISQVTLVEVVASICRKAYEQNIPVEKRDRTINNFRRDAQDIYRVRLVDDVLYIAAGNLCRSHRLRSYDAVQLACAITVREESLEVQPFGIEPSQFIFVSADHRLLDFARTEGLNIENPDHYS